MEKAFQCIKEAHGIDTESYYPYTATVSANLFLLCIHSSISIYYSHLMSLSPSSFSNLSGLHGLKFILLFL